MRWWQAFMPPCTFMPFVAWYHVGEPASALAGITFLMMALVFVLGVTQHGGATAVAWLTSPPAHQQAPDGADLVLPDHKPDGPLRPKTSRPPTRATFRERLASAFQWAVARSPRYLVCEAYALSSFIALSLVAFGGLAEGGRAEAFNRTLMDTGFAYLAFILLSTPLIPRALATRQS